ncbi:MAG: ABC transporter permease [Lachnospiraceae bacterium]|nr:ABC transporter permease [Lachnospiraceae bacterium]
MRKTLCTVFLAFMMVLLYLPIFVLAVYSFTDSANIGAIRGFSLQNYVTLFEKPELREMIAGTLALAVGSAFLSTILGTLGAVGVFYSGRFGNMVVGSLNQVPIVNAEVVTAFSLCILLIGACGVDKSSFVSLVIGHVVLEAPFVYVSVVPKLKQMDNSLYEAALDLGASPATALRCVVLPQIFPGVVSGFALAVTLSLDDYFITSYTKPATFDTISTYVVNATRGSQTEIKTALWALSTIIFAAVVLMVIIMNVTGNKNEKRAGAGNEKDR